MNKFFTFVTLFTLSTLGSLSAYISPEPPADFNPKMEVVGAFIEYGDRLLLLHRQDGTSQGNTWCVPGGKVEKNEPLLQATIRETLEETGYDLSNEKIEFKQTLYVKYSEKSQFLYHIFYIKLADPIANVKIDWKEHKGFTWVTPKDAIKMNMIHDLDYCLEILYGKQN